MNKDLEIITLCRDIAKKHKFNVPKYILSLKNNQCLHLTQLCDHMLMTIKSLTKYSQNYLVVPRISIGTRDFRARTGSFTNLFDCKTSPLYALPPLKFINDSLADLLDKRAIELINVAKNTGRKIAVMWSGGIDSTTVLTALLKNISEADQELLIVYLTIHSISDYQDFYFKFLSANKKISIKDASSLRIDNNFLDKTLILHGDPGDGIFGPSTSMYKIFSDNQIHLEPWKKHLKTLVQVYEPTFEKHMWVQPGIGEWFCDIISRTLEESGLADHVSSVTDWIWWTYFNFKWQGICTYPLHNSILGHQHQGITKENHKFYADNVFLASPEFQCWSYSNLKELIGLNVFKTHKLKAREYIYEFDKNFNYFSRKRKTSTPAPNTKLSKSRLIGHDENWKPMYIDPVEHQVVTSILRTI